MNISTQRIPYKDTGYFSKLVTDYLAGHPQLSSYYNHRSNDEGLANAIAQRCQSPVNRAALVHALQAQYASQPVHEQVRANVEALLQDTTFTVTTAHQPNIFTGPLYFIYKILHAVSLARHLQKQHPQYRFVPVYYMGSEDADLDELGYLNLNGEKMNWQTGQTGAVGRMIVDDALIELLNEIITQVSFLPHGKEVTEALRKAYKKNSTIEQATFTLVHALMGRYGLVILLPDRAALKQLFVPVMERELFQQFSHPLVAQTIGELSQHYKVQAAGRDINLFYLKDNIRNRIVANETGDGFAVVDTDIAFSHDEIKAELQQHPERFSPNVILRGLFQETTLPNIAFIGGGGELAYWLELKRVFEAANTPFPVLVLRNSFLLMQQEQQQQLRKNGIDWTQLFMPIHELEAVYVKKHTDKQLDLDKEKQQLASWYAATGAIAGRLNATLATHVNALHAKALKKIEALETKMLRAEKRNRQDALRQLNRVRNQLFPANNLQERVDNMLPLLAQHGPVFFDALLEHSAATGDALTTLTIS
jgi:bacillithiol synthase